MLPCPASVKRVVESGLAFVLDMPVWLRRTITWVVLGMLGVVILGPVLIGALLAWSVPPDFDSNEVKTEKAP